MFLANVAEKGAAGLEEFRGTLETIPVKVGVPRGDVLFQARYGCIGSVADLADQRFSRVILRRPETDIDDEYEKQCIMPRLSYRLIVLKELSVPTVSEIVPAISASRRNLDMKISVVDLQAGEILKKKSEYCIWHLTTE